MFFVIFVFLSSIFSTFRRNFFVITAIVATSFSGKVIVVSAVATLVAEVVAAAVAATVAALVATAVAAAVATAVAAAVASAVAAAVSAAVAAAIAVAVSDLVGLKRFSLLGKGPNCNQKVLVGS